MQHSFNSLLIQWHLNSSPLYSVYYSILPCYMHYCEIVSKIGLTSTRRNKRQEHGCFEWRLFVLLMNGCFTCIHLNIICI